MLETARLSYFRTALSGLRFLESREPTGRRFGEDADVLFRSYATRQMSELDRLELLIGDADRQWKGAFGARLVFDLPASSDDEAFGPSWERAAPLPVRDLWRDAFTRPPPVTPADVIAEWSAAWDRPLRAAAVDLAPNDRVTLIGASAIASAIDTLSARSDVAWHRQVEVVATEPAERQLALLAAPLLAAEGATALVERPSAGTRVISSGDARPSDLSALVDGEGG
jgi:hypothetical protein